jgi:hypothetical protein
MKTIQEQKKMRNEIRQVLTILHLTFSSIIGTVIGKGKKCGNLN